ncbi:MAG: hypothetical protein H0A76_08640 [Candidatus Thiodubiliella endoseptemdiera]|uniref:Uncharacterized protein n=1 Tax=Candidatus Thiodubiliella endoseptemdiera TaxID=2738886 RepID=A0A853F8C4_9GAMM|nr:hypothetical protein [Candidatus Thiodubiliella endoseptemdiera]
MLDISSETNILKVVGNSGDNVTTGLGFSDSIANETVDGVTYDVYTHSDANTDAKVALWIEQGLTVL